MNAERPKQNRPPNFNKTEPLGMSFGTTHFHWRKSTFAGSGGLFQTTRNFTGDFQNGIVYRPVYNLKG